MIQLKNSVQISAMIDAGRITGEALLVARESVRAGMSTKELDTIIRNHIEKCGAKPSTVPLNTKLTRAHTKQ